MEKARYGECCIAFARNYHEQVHCFQGVTNFGQEWDSSCRGYETFSVK